VANEQLNKLDISENDVFAAILNNQGQLYVSKKNKRR